MKKSGWHFFSLESLMERCELRSIIIAPAATVTLKSVHHVGWLIMGRDPSSDFPFQHSPLRYRGLTMATKLATRCQSEARISPRDLLEARTSGPWGHKHLGSRTIPSCRSDHAECLKHQIRVMQSSEENVDIIRESRSRCILTYNWLCPNVDLV